MTQIKAILSGIIAIFVLGLGSQFVVLMTNVYLIELAKTYSFIKGYENPSSFILGFISFAIITFIGGYISASIDQKHMVRSAIIAAVIATSISLWFSLRHEILTPMAFISLALCTLCAYAGAKVFSKKLSKSQV